MQLYIIIIYFILYLVDSKTIDKFERFSKTQGVNKEQLEQKK